MTLGERLKLAREYAGLTQDGLVDKSGVHQATISKIERGDAERSSFVVELAVACGVQPEWLAMERGEMCGGLYVYDDKIKHLVQVTESLPKEYGPDMAIKEITALAEFIKTATAAAKK